MTARYSLLDNLADSYYHLSGRVALDDIRGPGHSKMSVGLWGKNLTDEVYYTSGFNLTASLGFRSMAVGAPRTYGVDFVLEW